MGGQVNVQIREMFHSDGPLALVHGPNTMVINPGDNQMDESLVQHLCGAWVLSTVAVGIFSVHHRQQERFNKCCYAIFLESPPRFVPSLIHPDAMSFNMGPLGPHSPSQALFTIHIYIAAQGTQRCSRHFFHAPTKVHTEPTQS